MMLTRDILKKYKLAAIACILTLIFISVFGFISHKMYKALYDRNVTYRENIQWGIYQMQKEYLSTLVIANEIIREPHLNESDLYRQYDIFVSRVNIINSGNAFREIADQGSVRRALSHLLTAIRAIDERIIEFNKPDNALDQARIAQIFIENFKPLRDPVQEIMLFTVKHSTNYNSIQTEQMRSFIFLMGSTFILVVIMIALTGAAAFLAFRRIEQNRLALTLHEEALQASKLQSLGVLASGVAHEINSPAQFISDNLAFLEEELPFVMAHASPDAPQSEGKSDYLRAEIPLALAEMREGLDRIAEIVSAVRRFTYADDEPLKIVDFAEVIRLTMRLAKNQVKGVAHIEVDIPSHPIKVEGRPGELSQVLLNLITNSTDAIKERSDIERDASYSGVIRITVGYGNEKDPFGATGYRIKVSDNGIGVNQSVLTKVFDPFFTTKKLGDGTGQGLSICRNIIENYGGVLDFTGSVMKGACVTIHLRACD